MFQRILSLAPANTEILLELGMKEKIIGTTSYCTQFKNSHGPEIIGGWLNIDFGKIAGLKPDLILTSSFLQDKITQELKSKNFNVVQFDPKTVSDIWQSIVGIGKLVGKEKEGLQLANDCKEKFNSLKLKFSSSAQPKVYCEEWPNPPMVSGNWVPEIVEAAGGTCSSLISAGERSKAVQLEQLLSFQPDKIILNWCGANDRAKPELVSKRPGWEKLNAVQSNSIHVIDDNYLNSPDMRILKGVEEMAKAINK